MILVDENTPYWLGLARVSGLGVRGAHQLIRYFGSPQAVYQASLTELEGCGLPAPAAPGQFGENMIAVPAEQSLPEAVFGLAPSESTDHR